MTLKDPSPERLRQRKYFREWKQKRVAAGLCGRCGKPLDLAIQLCSACHELKIAYDKKRYKEGRADHQQLKDETLAAYGGAECRCCGETHTEFLTLDHVNGGGNAHRQSLTGSKAGGHFYRKLKELGFPNDPPLQVLCLNCNWAKGHYERCPHEQDPVRG